MANGGNGRRRTDVTRLSFPVQLVAVIVVSALTAMGSVYAMRDRITADQQAMRDRMAADQQAIRLEQAKLASDVRDILTRMEAAAKLADERAKAIDMVQKEQRLLDIKLQTVNEALIIIRGAKK